MIGSIPSGLANLDNLKEIGLARVLALTPFVGMIGKFYFYSSRPFVKTFNNLSRKVEAHFFDHNVIIGKPIPEYIGSQLLDFTFEIRLHSSLGIEPMVEVGFLQAMVESGLPQTIFLHGKTYGKYTVRGLEFEETHWSKGRPAIIDATLTLKEHAESLPVQSQMKLREQELSRHDTGFGGPDRIAGIIENEPIQERVLEPQIDPITRMVL